MKYYVDFAAQSGLEYMLVDAGWSPREDITKMNGARGHPRTGAIRRAEEREDLDLGALDGGATARWTKRFRCLKNGAWPA